MPWTDLKASNVSDFSQQGPLKWGLSAWSPCGFLKKLGRPNVVFFSYFYYWCDIVLIISLWTSYLWLWMLCCVYLVRHLRRPSQWTEARRSLPFALPCGAFRWLAAADFQHCVLFSVCKHFMLGVLQALGVWFCCQFAANYACSQFLSLGGCHFRINVLRWKIVAAISLGPRIAEDPWIFAENISSCLWRTCKRGPWALADTPPPAEHATQVLIPQDHAFNWRVSTYHIYSKRLKRVFFRMKCYMFYLKLDEHGVVSICQFCILGGFWHALIMVYVVRLITTGAWSCPSFHDWVFSSCHKLLVFNFHCWWKASLKELWHGYFQWTTISLTIHVWYIYPTFGWLGDGFKDFLFLKPPWGNDPIRQPRDLKWIGSLTNYTDGIA